MLVDVRIRLSRGNWNTQNNRNSNCGVPTEDDVADFDEAGAAFRTDGLFLRWACHLREYWHEEVEVVGIQQNNGTVVIENHSFAYKDRIRMYRRLRHMLGHGNGMNADKDSYCERASDGMQVDPREANRRKLEAVVDVEPVADEEDTEDTSLGALGGLAEADDLRNPAKGIGYLCCRSSALHLDVATAFLGLLRQLSSSTL